MRKNGVPISMNIIVVFPKIENAKSIRSILQKGGYTVDAVCSTGAQALQAANDLDSGIIICTYRLADMMYSELYEYLTPRYDMLLIGSKSQIAEREIQGVVGLAIPLKVHELLQTIEMMACAFMRNKKKEKKRRPKPNGRSAEEKRMIAEAKALLMERNHFSEQEAHSYLQKCSMDSGTGLAETAQMVLSMMGPSL